MNNDIPIDPDNFFGQMTSVLGGLFLLLLGTANFYTIAYWRLRGQRLESLLIGNSSKFRPQQPPSNRQAEWPMSSLQVIPGVHRARETA